MKTKSFFQFILKSRTRKTFLLLILSFSILARLYMYYAAAALPCDGGFLCGFWRYVGLISWGEVVALDLASWVPLTLVVLSYYGLFKRAEMFPIWQENDLKK